MPLTLQEGSTSYVTGPGGLPLEQIIGSTVYYYHQDQLGSTLAISDSSGSVQATYTYDAYGNLTASTGSLTNPFRFAGQFVDIESGLYYLRARYYDTISAQMISADALRQRTRQAFSYASDNPLTYSDPSGLCDINPLSGSSCLSAGASWVYQNASTISAVTGTAAAILAPIPGVDVLAVPLAGVAFATGVIAADKDIVAGQPGAAALDIAGAVPGFGSLVAVRYARILEDMARDSEAAYEAATFIDEGERYSELQERFEGQAWRFRYAYMGLAGYSGLNAVLPFWYEHTGQGSVLAASLCGG
jgi:RHS repeat-associated protein